VHITSPGCILHKSNARLPSSIYKTFLWLKVEPSLKSPVDDFRTRWRHEVISFFGLSRDRSFHGYIEHRTWSSNFSLFFLHRRLYIYFDESSKFEVLRGRSIFASKLRPKNDITYGTTEHRLIGKATGVLAPQCANRHESGLEVPWIKEQGRNSRVASVFAPHNLYCVFRGTSPPSLLPATSRPDSWCRVSLPISLCSVHGTHNTD
jgi:hypothetical protein